MCAVDVPGEGVGRFRGAGPVKRPLQNFPVTCDRVDGRQNRSSPGRLVLRAESIVRAQRRDSLEVRAEPQAHAARETLARGRESGIDQRRAAGVAEEERSGVLGETQLLLQRLSDHLQIPRGVPARALSLEGGLAKGRIRQSRDGRRRSAGRAPRHVDDPFAPAVVSAHEEDGPAWRARRNIHARLAHDRQAQRPLLDRLRAGRGRGRRIGRWRPEEQTDGEREGNHEVPRLGCRKERQPPAISTDTCTTASGHSQNSGYAM